MSKWHTILKCENCGASGVLEHDEETYPEFCPHCGLDGNGATGTQEQADKMKEERKK